MLEKLLLRDFQSHKKLVIEFDKRVTSIVGASDAGKSAIMRALTWVMFNTPAGDDFIRHEQKRAKAVLWVDGHKVRRVRGGKVNTYELDGAPFNAFGAGVPPEVADLLRVSEINFQGQHEAPFWFSETAGGVSRRLNEIVDLAIIDEVLGAVAGKLRTARTEAELIEERVVTAVKEKKALRYVLEMDEQLVAVEALEEVREKAYDQASALRDLLDKAGVARETKKAEGLRAEQGATLLDLAERWREKRKAVSNLRTAMEEVRTTKQRKKDLDEKYKRLHEQLHRELGGQCPLCGGEMK